MSPENLLALIDNEIPAISIPGFASAEECEAFSEAVLASPDLHSYSVSIPTHYLGIVVYEYRQGDGRKEEFFREAPKAAAALNAVFVKSFDPVERFLDIIGKNFSGDASVAHEPGFGDYCSTVSRVATGGVHLHADYAPFNSPGWSIGDITAQITWNLYTRRPASGGQTTVFNKPWTPGPGEDPARGLANDEVLSDPETERYTFEPKVGEVVMFNPRNPHVIAPGDGGTGGDRITIGSFMGMTKSRDLVMWG
jgi:hypothetical protein